MASQHITTNLLRLRLRRLLDLDRFDRVALRVVLPGQYGQGLGLSIVMECHGGTPKKTGLFQGKSPEMDDLGYREVALLKRKPPFLRIRDDHGHRGDPWKTHVVFGCSWAESLEFWDDIII